MTTLDDILTEASLKNWIYETIQRLTIGQLAQVKAFIKGLRKAKPSP